MIQTFIIFETVSLINSKTKTKIGFYLYTLTKIINL
jgi:hypothetical protein